ncbi:MAG: right-handed parallel beta-helix repeat-containing protein, partial [Candidatus Heimdallarchaeota archaeon]|nr:right-handed parallel beta-helix repeat-containing protein [Candidatus Heimdallarchaeota archaeon]
VNYIENKLYSNTEHGLHLESSDSCNITENLCYSNTRDGIYLSNSLLNSLTHNECYLNNYNGIYVLSGSFNTLENNYLHNNNRDGIKITSSTSNTIANNTLYNNDWYGISNYATSTSILDNNATKDGFGIFLSSQGAYDGLSVGGNTVNGKPLGYINGLGEATLAPNVYGQLILAFCNGTTVKDETIADTSIALIMVGCENITVDNCNFDNNNFGSIRLVNSMKTTIQNTKCSYNEEYGGIYSTGTPTNTSIYNVTANNNQFGIFLMGATVFNVSHCTVMSNFWYNTRFQGCVAGNIRYNVITNSAAVGMLLYGCDYTNISYNCFEDNLGYAIYSDDDSWYNWIHHNAFISNNLGGTSQAFDDSLFNMWDDPWNMEGNYWDDWVSGNYTIDGIGQANDSYPLGDVPPGVIIYEFNQFSLLIFLLPVVFVSMVIIRKRKR